MAIVSRDYQYGDRSFEDIKRSLAPFLILIFSFTGVLWVSWKGVNAGSIYTNLFLYGISIIFLLTFLTKSTDKRYEIPFSTTVSEFSIFFILGGLIPLLLFTLAKIFPGGVFSLFSDVAAKSFVPLTFPGAGQSQTFSAITTIADPFWKAFVIVFTAGTIEPFAIGFASVAVGVIIGYVIRKLLKLDFGQDVNKWFDFVIAMIYSTAFFVIIHTLNDSYTTTGMFVAAGVFRVIMNVSLYYFNFTISFLFGFHQMFNATAIGLGNTLGGFLSHPYGILILTLYFLIFVNFLINIPKLPAMFKRVFSEVGL